MFHRSGHESSKILGLSLTQAISTDSIPKPAHNDQSHFPHAGISLSYMYPPPSTALLFNPDTRPSPASGFYRPESAVPSTSTRYQTSKATYSGDIHTILHFTAKPTLKQKSLSKEH